MSVPKKKRTSGSVGRRNSHSALKKTTLTTCPDCNKPILPHTACPACGSYKGKKVVVKNVKTKTGKSSKKA